jgi:hypothetical protein
MTVLLCPRLKKFPTPVPASADVAIRTRAAAKPPTTAPLKNGFAEGLPIRVECQRIAPLGA